jgi:hypothetical protein
MNNLTKLVDKIIREVKQTDSRFVSLYDKARPLYPLPFFGDLENAEVMTIAVNPSPTEFKSERGWACGLTSEQLTHRLVTYFTRFPHQWFSYLEKANLIPDGDSFFRNTAHIDLSPRATRKMGEFHGNSAEFLDMVNDDANKWLPQLFQLAEKKRKFRIYGKIVSRSNSGSRQWCEWPWLDDYIKDELPEIWALIKKYDYDRIEISSCEMN